MMTLLSKLVLSRRGQAGLGRVWARMFRWDAKPDNIQGHSFPTGLRAPAHWTIYFLSGIGLSLILNWKELRRQFGIRFPNVLVDDSLEFYNRYINLVFPLLCLHLCPGTQTR